MYFILLKYVFYRVHFLGSFLSDSKWELMWVAFGHIELENCHVFQIYANSRCREVFKVLLNSYGSKNLTILLKSILTQFWIKILGFLAIFQLRRVNWSNKSVFKKFWRPWFLAFISKFAKIGGPGGTWVLVQYQNKPHFWIPLVTMQPT